VFKKIFYPLQKKASAKNTTRVSRLQIIEKEQHHITRNNIPKNVLKILARLQDKGYSSYLVGGSVRDILLGHTHKDFDVATDATPTQIKAIFRNAYIIGRRFKLVHVRFGKDIIEVTTFRADKPTSFLSRFSSKHKRNAAGFLLKDNVYGSIEDDASRRDLTINALYYDAKSQAIHDYTGGIADLTKRELNIIGDPAVRYQEDPVRILRIVRFAAKLNFSIATASAKPISSKADLLLNVSPSRMYHEATKLFCTGYSYPIFNLLEQYQLLDKIFPGISLPKDKQELECLQLSLENTDKRVKNNQHVTLSFIYAAILWHTLKARISESSQQGYPSLYKVDEISESLIKSQLTSVNLPKFISTKIKNTWKLQYRMEHPKCKPEKIVLHKEFRAAYDFLTFRLQSGELVKLETFEQLTSLYKAGSTSTRNEKSS
jgi:poly(A) polymerase